MLLNYKRSLIEAHILRVAFISVVGFIWKLSYILKFNFSIFHDFRMIKMKNFLCDMSTVQSHSLFFATYFFCSMFRGIAFFSFTFAVSIVSNFVQKSSSLSNLLLFFFQLSRCTYKCTNTHTHTWDKKIANNERERKEGKH